MGKLRSREWNAGSRARGRDKERAEGPRGSGLALREGQGSVPQTTLRREWAINSLFQHGESQRACQGSQPASISMRGESTQAGLRPKRKGWGRGRIRAEADSQARMLVPRPKPPR